MAEEHSCTAWILGLRCGAVRNESVALSASSGCEVVVTRGSSAGVPLGEDHPTRSGLRWFSDLIAVALISLYTIMRPLWRKRLKIPSTMT